MYRYDNYTDSFVRISGEPNTGTTSTKATVLADKAETVRKIELTEECIGKIADAFNRVADEIQLFREAFVANNISICDSCLNNPCNKKVMLGDRRIFECTLFEPRVEQTERSE